MNPPKSPFPVRKSRLGMHYFADTLHFRQQDLETWLPRLKAMDISWLVLQSPADRAIPEHFISGLVQEGIEPLIQFCLPLGPPVELAEMDPLFSAYSRWGARAVMLYDRPNERTAWPPYGWTQDNLVERFLDRFVPLGNLANHHQLAVIFPPLQPGGSYWDTAFLRSALESLVRRKQTRLLQDMVLSAYAWSGGHSLNWGAGGPDRWPEAHPYYTASDEPDQRGFRIFDWYLAISRAVLENNLPIILLGAGLSGNPFETGGYSPTDEAHIRTCLAIADLLAGRDTLDPSDGKTPLEALPAAVVTANYWLLASEQLGAFFHHAWYRGEDKEMPIAQAFRGRSARASKAPPSQNPSAQPKTDPTPAAVNHPTRCIRHYLLLPTYDFGVVEWHLNIIRPFIKKHRPTVGFSLEEAALAERITVLGGEQVFPEEKLEQLRHAGSIVERIQGDGTSIATQLAER